MSSPSAADNRTALNKANQAADADYYGSGTADSGVAGGSGITFNRDAVGSWNRRVNAGIVAAASANDWVPAAVDASTGSSGSSFPNSEVVARGVDDRGLAWTEWSSGATSHAVPPPPVIESYALPSDVQGAGLRTGSPGALGYLGGAAEMLLGGAFNQVVRFGGGLASIPYAIFDGVDAAVAIQDATRANLGYTLKSDGATAILGHLAPVVSYVQDNVINPTRAFSETHLGDGMTTVLGASLQAGAEIYGTVTGVRAAGSFAIESLDAAFTGPLSGSRAAQLGAINLSSSRYQPGVVTFGDDLVPASGNWLSAATPTPIPLQVAQALDGQSFKTFGDLRSAVWRTIAADEDLSASFRLKSFTELQEGRAPFAPPAFQNEQFGLKFNLHHVDSIATGGGVYDLSNLRIVSPTVHSLLHGD